MVKSLEKVREKNEKVREKSGKSQGILKSTTCGNHVNKKNLGKIIAL